ncbi:MAG: LD-carboxypeptidase [Thermoguttaceae bacterium]|nr:LD-carboxypeptidase [Thermoguttaceae bacterium]
MKSMLKNWTLLAFVLAAFATSQAEQAANAQSGSEDDAYYSEGVDTKCEITGYKPYQGAPDSYFLKEGDKIAVISPSAIPSQAQVDATVEGLKKWGYVPVMGKYVNPSVRTLDELLDDVRWALSDPEIKAIFCVRGGYGATEAMDRLGLDAIRDAKKPIVGYSDITVYHSAWTSAGLPSIHSSMSAAFMGMPEVCTKAQERVLRGEIPSYKFEASPLCVEGEATGILIGGNLTTFSSTLGAAYDCAKMDEPYILFLEEVGGNLQRLHRYFMLLKHLGVLDKAVGFVFGEWTDLPTDGTGNFGASRGGQFESLAEMVRRQFLKDANVPVAFGFPAGHGSVNYPLLMGAKVRLRVADGNCFLEWGE